MSPLTSNLCTFEWIIFSFTFPALVSKGRRQTKRRGPLQVFSRYAQTVVCSAETATRHRWERLALHPAVACVAPVGWRFVLCFLILSPVEDWHLSSSRTASLLSVTRAAPHKTVSWPARPAHEGGAGVSHSLRVHSAHRVQVNVFPHHTSMSTHRRRQTAR